MEFTEYEKMSDSLTQYEDSKPFDDTDWAVTEKIHGANFSLHTDGNTVKAARRRDFLNDENFYNHHKAAFMKDCPEKVKALFPVIQEIAGCKIKQVTVYGELFGGKYEHPSVIVERQGKKTRPVQGEIQYCPDIHYFAFDISYKKNEEDNDKEEDPDALKHVYLDFEQTLKLFAQYGIPFMKPLFIGKANKALNYELGFDSCVPKELGLPPLPQGTNKAEGVVIRPMRELVCRTTKNHLERVMVKLKVPEFDDRRDQKGKIVKQRADHQKGKKESSNKSNKRPDKELLAYLVTLTTENKLVSAISKVGYPDNEETEKSVLEEMFQDLLSDAFENFAENETLWESLDTKRKEAVSNSVRAKIRALIQRYKAKTEEDSGSPS